jgi:hypothetical protein
MVPYHLRLCHPNAAVRNTYQSHEHVAGYSIQPRGGVSSLSKCTDSTSPRLMAVSSDLSCQPTGDQPLGSLQSNSVNKIGDPWGLATSNSYGNHLNPDPGSLPLQGSPVFALDGKGINAQVAKGSELAEADFALLTDTKLDHRLQGSIWVGNTMSRPECNSERFDLSPSRYFTAF